MANNDLTNRPFADLTNQVEQLKQAHNVKLERGERYDYVLNFDYVDRHDKYHKEATIFTDTAKGRQHAKPATFSLFEGDEQDETKLMSDWKPEKQPNVARAKEVKQEASDLANELFTDLINGKPKGTRIVFYGSFGTGKSMLAKAIYNQMNGAGVSTLFISAIALFDLFQDKLNKDAKANLHWDSLMKAIDEAQLVILDDVGTEIADGKSNAAVQRYMRTISGKRQNKPLLITTNDTQAELTKKYGGATADRIYTKNPKYLVSFADLVSVRST